jgi:hypothetical protein
MPKFWCVNFESVDCLHHGIQNNLWLMGYQYAKKGGDAPARKAAITRNWKRLEQITVGDGLVAYHGRARPPYAPDARRPRDHAATRDAPLSPADRHPS